MEAQWYDSPITGNVQLSWVRIIVQSCMTASTHTWSPDLVKSLTFKYCELHQPVFPTISSINSQSNIWTLILTRSTYRLTLCDSSRLTSLSISDRHKPLVRHASNFETHSPSRKSHCIPIAICHSKNHGFRWHRFDRLHPWVCRHPPKWMTSYLTLLRKDSFARREAAHEGMYIRQIELEKWVALIPM